MLRYTKHTGSATVCYIKVFGSSAKLDFYVCSYRRRVIRIYSQYCSLAYYMAAVAIILVLINSQWNGCQKVLLNFSSLVNCGRVKSFCNFMNVWHQILKFTTGHIKQTMDKHLYLLCIITITSTGYQVTVTNCPQTHQR